MLFSHGSGIWKSQTKVQSGLDSVEASLPGPHMVLSAHAHETESSGISTSSDKDISPIGLGPSLMTSFNPNYPVKALSPKCCPFGGDTIQSITRRTVKHLLAHLEMHRLHACPFIRRSATA